jgi:prepilin peptidase CpaA
MVELPSLERVLVALFIGLVATAAVEDIRRYRIPNAIVLPLLALYPLYVLVAAGSVDWAGGLLTALPVFAAGVVLFALRAMGGGDVKLLAACALWAGPDLIFPFLVVTAIAGGLAAMVMIGATRYGLAMLLDAAHLTRPRDLLLADVIPYGLAICAGGALVGSVLMLHTFAPGAALGGL